EPSRPLVDPSKCVVEGDGLNDGIKVEKDAVFKVFPMSSEGKLVGKMEPEHLDDWKVSVTTPDGENIDANLTANDDGSFSATYTPMSPGSYLVSVQYNGKDIKGSPFPVAVHPVGDGMESVAMRTVLETDDVLVNNSIEFTIQTRDKDGNDLTQGGELVEVDVDGPQQVQAVVTDN